MSARSFQVVIQNRSSFNLNQTFNHLCHGEWKPGGWIPSGWAPPDSIPPGQKGGWIAESNGFMTGTEGYVKYNVNSASGKRGMFYFYWDNPFYGITHFRPPVAALEDVYPDCDFEIPEGQSTFPGTGEFDFGLKFESWWNGVDGGDVTGWQDFMRLIDGPVYILGTLGIIKHPILTFSVTDGTTQSGGNFDFEGLGTESLKPLKDALSDEWVGRWSASGIDIRISPTERKPPLLAVINAQSISPALSFQEEFAPGPEGMLKHLVKPIASLVEEQKLDDSEAKAFNQAAVSLIAEAAQKKLTAVALAKRFDSLAGNESTTPPKGFLAKRRIVGRSIVKLAVDRGEVAYLKNNVALHIFGTFQSNRQIGKKMQFQRLSDHGTPLSSVMLNFIPDIR